MAPLDAPEPLRISDAERHEAAERLNAFFAEGRLDLEESSARRDEVYAARTDADLEHAFRGLPKLPAKNEKKERRRGVRPQVERLVAISTPGIICTAIWAMTGGHGNFWPEWVWFGTGVMMLRSVQRGHRRADRDRSLGEGHSTPGSSTGVDRRMVLTAVFADIVGSTERAATMGDGSWRDLLRSFEHMVERELGPRDGRKLFSKGDEVVATFRSPARAVEYARAIREGALALGLELREGIHTGEVEGRGSDLGGIALHIGQRISANAAPGEILASSTVRDLVHGSGIEFVDRGDHELRGIAGPWHLYEVAGRAPGT